MANAKKTSGDNINVMDWVENKTITFDSVEEAERITEIPKKDIEDCIKRKQPVIFGRYVFAREDGKFDFANSKEAIKKATSELKEHPDFRPVYYQQTGSSKWYVCRINELAEKLNTDVKSLVKNVKKLYPRPFNDCFIKELWEEDVNIDDAVLVGKCKHGGMCLSEKDSIFHELLKQYPANEYQSDKITFYSDGSTAPTNPGPSAFGICGIDDRDRRYSCWGFVGPMESNNRAEMFGYIRILEMILHFKWKEVTAYFDSRYVLDSATKYIKLWRKNGWKKATGDIISNRAEWERIAALQDAVKELGTKITYKWVKGHSGDEGNELADVNAERGRLAGLNGETDPVLVIVGGKEADAEKEAKEESAKASKKPKVKPCNKLICCSRLIFTTNTPMRTKDGRCIYLTNSFEGSIEKTGRFIGKPASNNMYGVVLTEEPVEPIQAIFDYQNKITPGDFVQPVVGIMPRIVRPDNWTMLNEYGNAHLKHNRLNICTREEEPLTLYQRPARLAYDAIDILMNMLDRLDRHRLSIKDKNSSTVDITKYIYDTDGKKLKLKGDISQATKAIIIPLKYEGKEAKVTLTMGIDLPDRTHLNALPKQGKDITVNLLRYDETKSGFRYSVIIKVDNDIAIYSTSMANIKTV